MDQKLKDDRKERKKLLELLEVESQNFLDPVLAKPEF